MAQVQDMDHTTEEIIDSETTIEEIQSKTVMVSFSLITTEMEEAMDSLDFQDFQILIATSRICKFRFHMLSEVFLYW